GRGQMLLSNLAKLLCLAFNSRLRVANHLTLLRAIVAPLGHRLGRFFHVQLAVCSVVRDLLLVEHVLTRLRAIRSLLFESASILHDANASFDPARQGGAWGLVGHTAEVALHSVHGFPLPVEKASGQASHRTAESATHGPAYRGTGYGPSHAGDLLRANRVLRFDVRVVLIACRLGIGRGFFHPVRVAGRSDAE